MSASNAEHGEYVTYRGHRLWLPGNTNRRIILLGETTAQFSSMAAARTFIRFLVRLAKEEGQEAVAAPPESLGRRKRADDSDAGSASTAGGRSTRPPSSASRRARALNRAAELDEAWRWAS